MIICICSNVNEKTIKTTIKQNVNQINNKEDVFKLLDFEFDCGTCEKMMLETIDKYINLYKSTD